MMILRRLLPLNRQLDVASLVAGARDPELVSLETRLAELQKAEIAAGREWWRWRDEADPNISTLRPKTTDAVKAAEVTFAEITLQRDAINREIAEVLAKIADAKPASLAAVMVALAPVRERAAQDIEDAMMALYAAIALY